GEREEQAQHQHRGETAGRGELRVPRPAPNGRDDLIRRPAGGLHRVVDQRPAAGARADHHGAG
ncbi:MAG: hypothetical protein JWQ23_4519, partial [Herminiimonas sp.]|nr:hypothetical protein [Herminiimonas sp.]